MTSAKTVLVTGGAGFIGLHVVPMLVQRGYDVRIFDNMFRGDRERVPELEATGHVELIDQDVRYGAAVQQAMRGCESVIHLAAVSINKGLADPYESIDVNLVGTTMCCRRLIIGCDAVFASSASVYGDGTIPCTRTTG
jgi:UDP-glucose 4-epimerase